MCTEDGRPLSNSPSATVAGPPGLSVADAQVDEGPDAALAFAVTLGRAASGTVTVSYAKSDGTAAADYTAASGALTFAASETAKTVSVAVLDDSLDEESETLTLTLSSPSGAYLADDVATGTIVNSDPLPKALLARFGRTAAVHVVEHVEERLRAPREPGFEGRVGGRELRPGMEREIAAGFIRQLGGAGGVQGASGGMHGSMAGSPLGGAGPLGAAGPGGGLGLKAAASAGPMGAGMGAGVMGIGAGPGATGTGLGVMGAGATPSSGLNDNGFLDMGFGSMGFGGDRLLTGSAFSLNRETDRDGALSFWSRGAQSYFTGRTGREGALSLGGDVRTTMVGAGYAKGPLAVGLSLANSRGMGEYASRHSGRVASAVTGLYPWLGYRLTERVSVWGGTGYGAGGMLPTPEGGPTLESGLSMKPSSASLAVPTQRASALNASPKPSAPPEIRSPRVPPATILRGVWPRPPRR